MHSTRRYVFGCGHGEYRVLPPQRNQTAEVLCLPALRVVGANDRVTRCHACAGRAHEQDLLQRVHEHMEVAQTRAQRAACNVRDDEDPEQWPANPPIVRHASFAIGPPSDNEEENTLSSSPPMQALSPVGSANLHVMHEGQMTLSQHIRRIRVSLEDRVALCQIARWDVPIGHVIRETETDEEVASAPSMSPLSLSAPPSCGSKTST